MNTMIFTVSVTVDDETSETEVREGIRNACDVLNLPDGSTLYTLAVDVEYGITVEEP